MLRNRSLLVTITLLLLGGSAFGQLDTAKIEEAARAKGTLSEEEGVFKVTYPRNDVPVRVDGTVLPPFMGLTSWADLEPGVKEEAIVAIHHHMESEEPKVLSLHYWGRGPTTMLARSLKTALDLLDNEQNAKEPSE